MKLLILSLLLATNAVAQMTARKGPILYGSGQKKPDPTAILELFSKAQGFLPPRLTTAERDAITTPAEGLEIYNLDSGSPQFFNGITWVSSGGTGTSFLYTSTAHGRTIGCPLSPVYFDGTEWVDARADNQTTLATHVITKVIDANTLEISQSGRFSCNAHGLSLGTHYYTGVSGGLANMPAPAYDNPLVFVENANIVHVMPYRASTPAIRTIGQVDLVFGRIGDVVAEYGDYNAAQIPFAPDANYIATDVQAALVEVGQKVADVETDLATNYTPLATTIGTSNGIQGGGALSGLSDIELDFGGLSADPINTADYVALYNGTNHYKALLSDILAINSYTLGDLTDVNTAAASGQVLTFNGTDFSFTDKTVDTDDQNASEVSYTPFSFYTSNNVQDIIPEIETSLRSDLANKAENSTAITAGFGLTGGGLLSSANIPLAVDPSQIDITTLNGFNPNSYVDMSTVQIDVTDVNDGLKAFNPTLDSDVTMAVDIPSLSLEDPAKISTQLMGFSVVTNKLVKVNVQSVADTAAAAVVVPVDEVNGYTGIVNLDADDIPETATRKWFSPTDRTDITNNTSNITSNDTDIANNAANISANATAIGQNDVELADHETRITDNRTDINSNIATLSSLGSVAFSDDYNDLVNLPVLGTAAATAATDYATAAQGALADSALQPLDNVSELTNDANYITSAGAPIQSVNTQTGVVVLDADDIDDTSTLHKFATQAQLDQIATNQSNISTNATNIASNDTDIATNASDIATNATNIGSNDTELADHETRITQNEADILTHRGDINSNDTELADHETRITQNATDISTNSGNIASNSTALSSLAPVANSGDYNDLINLPTLGTAAATAATDYATAAQGALADSALQPSDNISTLTNDANYITSAGAPVQSVNSKVGAVTLNASEIPYTPVGTANYSPIVADVKAALDQLEQRNTDAQGRLTTNEANISQNSTDIASNGTDISGLDTRLTTAEGNITSNDTDITNLQTNKYDASNPSGFETPAQLTTRDTANRARANHTGTQLSTTISDFGTRVRTEQRQQAFLFANGTTQTAYTVGINQPVVMPTQLTRGTKITDNGNGTYTLAAGDYRIHSAVRAGDYSNDGFVSFQAFRQDTNVAFGSQSVLYSNQNTNNFNHQPTTVAYIRVTAPTTIHIRYNFSNVTTFSINLIRSFIEIKEL